MPSPMSPRRGGGSPGRDALTAAEVDVMLVLQQQVDSADMGCSDGTAGHGRYFDAGQAHHFG